jgi:hypothetical protein
MAREDLVEIVRPPRGGYARRTSSPDAIDVAGQWQGNIDNEPGRYRTRWVLEPVDSGVPGDGPEPAQSLSRTPSRG